MSGDDPLLPCDAQFMIPDSGGAIVSCTRPTGHGARHRDAQDRVSWDDPPAWPSSGPKPFVPAEKAPRDVVLDTARELISGERAKTYGDSTESHRRIGKIWGAILGTEPVPPATVALMMAGLKISRAAGDPTHEDSYVDMAGYAALGYEAARKDAP